MVFYSRSNFLMYPDAGRPHRSRFTRIQRLTCCLSLLFCTMFANILFYQGDEAQSSSSPPIKVLGRLSSDTIFVAILQFPFCTFFLYQFFWSYHPVTFFILIECIFITCMFALKLHRKILKGISSFCLLNFVHSSSHHISYSYFTSLLDYSFFFF